MGQYALRRILLAIPTILVSTIVVFLLLRVLPGDAALIIALGEDYRGQADEATINANSSVSTGRCCSNTSFGSRTWPAVTWVLPC